jgi:hypothetical protein
MDEVKFRELPDQTRNAVRLLGGAALPAHFPPYIGTSSYSVLTKKRMAVILRNYRRALDFLKSIPKGPTVEHFSHGLYIKLGSAQEFDEKTARQAAREPGASASILLLLNGVSLQSPKAIVFAFRFPTYRRLCGTMFFRRSPSGGAERNSATHKTEGVTVIL